MLQLQAVVALNRGPFESGLSSISAAVSKATGAMMMAFGGVAGEIFAMTKAFGAMGAAVGIMKKSVSVGASFEQQMANVASVSGLVGDELTGVSAAAMDMAKTTRFTATQAGDALYSLASAGISTADAMTATLRPALLLAGATLSNTSLATETMTAALANFKIPASDATRVADQFAGAIASSPANMERLGDAFKYAGPAAAGFGISLEKTVAEVAAFHVAGMRGGMAGTAFRQVLIQLSQASEDTASVIGSALQGWTAGTEGITGAVERLNAAGVDTDLVIRELGARAGPALAAMMQLGSEAMQELAVRISESADVAKMYETQINTLSGRFAIFKSAVEDVFLKIYGELSPVLTEATQKAIELADAFGDLITAVFAGDWDTVKTMMTSAFDAAVVSARNAIEAAKDFFAAVLSALGLDSTIQSLKNLFNSLQETVKTMGTAASGVFNRLADVKWSEILNAALETIDDALSLIADSMTAVVKAVDWLIKGWQSLSDETRAVIAVIGGTAGLTVVVLALDAAITRFATVLVGTAVKSLASFAAASTSASAAFAAFPVAATAAVAAAGAVGAALGLLIRQIPGVAEAMDSLAEKTLRLIGVFEDEDEALKRKREYWRKEREANQDLIKAKSEAREAADEYIQKIKAENDAIAEAVLAEIAAEKATSNRTETVKKLSPFLDEMRKSQEQANSAMENAAVGLVALGPTTRAVIGNIDDMNEANEEAAKSFLGYKTPVDRLFDDLRKGTVAMTDFEAASRGLKDGVLDAADAIDETAESSEKSTEEIEKLHSAFGEMNDFDVANFTSRIKLLAAGLRGLDMPDISLPDISDFRIPNITNQSLTRFATALLRLSKITGVDLSALTTISKTLKKIKIPEIDGVSKFLAAMATLRDGLVKLDFGKVGTMSIDIKGSVVSQKLDDIYKLLRGAEGVIWA